MSEPRCRICDHATEPAGTRFGTFAQREFHYRHCPSCRFSFVSDPWTDFAAIYSEDYYTGRGADPYLDYLFELEQPGKTLRRYEWDGLLDVVRSLAPVSADTRWLDYGCGNGGMVRRIRETEGCEIEGFEEGWIVPRAREHGIPILAPADLAGRDGSYDIITAIEVLEHIFDPLETLRQIHRLLKPGGLFFYTTGNARPHRGRLNRWHYALPEIHVSYFEPETLAAALERAGFDVEFPGWRPGHSDVIRFKFLKTIGVRRRGALESLLPWSIFSRALNARLSLTAHPIGRKKTSCAS